MVFCGRDLLVGQRTQIINALRGHMAEHGWIAPKGPSHIARLADLLADEDAVPAAARPVLAVMLEMLAELDRRIMMLDREIAKRARAVMADLRAGGDIIGGPRAFSKANRSRFLSQLDDILVSL